MVIDESVPFGFGSFFFTAWSWCIRCERVWPTIEWVENDWRCPTSRCDGGFDDMWHWDDESPILQQHPEYPEIPEMGEHYPY